MQTINNLQYGDNKSDQQNLIVEYSFVQSSNFVVFSTIIFYLEIEQTFSVAVTSIRNKDLRPTTVILCLSFIGESNIYLLGFLPLCPWGTSSQASLSLKMFESRLKLSS